MIKILFSVLFFTSDEFNFETAKKEQGNTETFKVMEDPFPSLIKDRITHFVQTEGPFTGKQSENVQKSLIFSALHGTLEWFLWLKTKKKGF